MYSTGQQDKQAATRKHNVPDQHSVQHCPTSMIHYLRSSRGAWSVLVPADANNCLPKTEGEKPFSLTVKSYASLYLGCIQEVKSQYIHRQRQALEGQHCGEEGGALDLRHRNIGHVPLKGLGGVEAVALARAGAASSPRPLHCLDPAQDMVLLTGKTNDTPSMQDNRRKSHSGTNTAFITQRELGELFLFCHVSVVIVS